MNYDRIRPGSLLPRAIDASSQLLIRPSAVAAAFLMLAVWPCQAQTAIPAEIFAPAPTSLFAAIVRPESFAAAVQGQPLLALREDASAASAADPIAVESLPDAPWPQQSTASPQDSKPLMSVSPSSVRATTPRPVVSRYLKYIPAGAAAPQIHGREKLILGARDLYSAGNFLDMIFSAGWDQVTNGQPNYGTDRDAFGQRLGAAAIRETSEGILTDGVFSVMLHEDPRYFVLGPKYGLMHRTLYAITRPLVTRNSSNGRPTLNGALLLGYAGSTALTNAYYPMSNRNFHDNVSSFGGSIGGAALGFFIDEFSAQVFETLHLKKKS